MSNDVLEPFQSEALKLPNRVCMAPMTRARTDNAGHVPNDLMVEYYRARATAGLIITEGTHVSSMANGWEHVPGIYTPEQVEGWRRVTDAVHAEGGRIWCQLWHQGRMSHPDLLGGKAPQGPSPVTAKGVAGYLRGGYQQGPVPEAMKPEQIAGAIEEFKQAAKNADAAGFDGVEVHGANGYLVHQFLSDQSNVRQDEWGGTVENRARFLFAVLDAIREVLPAERVGLRLSPSMNDMQGLWIDGPTNATFDYAVERLSDYELAYLHLLEPMKPVDAVPGAVKEVARHFRPMYRGTLMINKGFTLEKANAVIAEGLADLVSFGVPYIANPDLVHRFRDGLPLSKPNPKTFYTTGPEGYTTYSAVSSASQE